MDETGNGDKHLLHQTVGLFLASGFQQTVQIGTIVYLDAGGVTGYQQGVA